MPKSSMERADADATEVVDDLARPALVTNERPFGDLEDEVPRRNRVPAHGVFDLVRQRRVEEIDRTEIHGELEVEAELVPLLPLARRRVTLERALVEHPSGSSAEPETALEVEDAAASLSTRPVPAPGPAPSPQPRDGIGVGADTRGGGTAWVPEQPAAGVPSAPTALPFPPEPGTQTETEAGVIDPADAPPKVEDTVDPVVDTASELPLPLPLPDVGVGVVTEIVPDDPLPLVDLPGATDPGLEPPLPGLPPLP